MRPTETVEPQPPGGDLEILPVGTLLSGRFELGRAIGWGGYAVVYEAIDRELHRRVAVKVLRGERVRPSTVARMRREVAVARDVTSPRLVKLYDIGKDGPHTFITMELVEGRALRDVLLAGPLDFDEALRIADQILEALGTLHDAGIVHRDLKPGNILVTPGGEVKLADFGLARHWQNEEMQVTATEGLVGTMEYLSPEQALGQELDPRSDLYSFGVVLYEMLSGRLPFGSSSSLGTVVAHVTTHAPDLRQSRAGIPLWLSLLVRRLLEKQREHRPSSADDVRRALREKAVDWGYRWKTSRARALVIAALLVATAAASTWGWSHYWSRFDHIASDSENILRAYDRRGRVLWSMPDGQVGRRAAIVNLRPGERRIAVVRLDDPSKPDAGRASARPIRLLDPQSGAETGTVPLPTSPHIFPVEPRFDIAVLMPVDTNHDGADEILVAYVHFYWPSYTVLADPRNGFSSIMFYASGHHRPLGTVDLDGDGNDEVLFSGPNNRMGWRNGVAAVRPRFVTEGETRVLSANTPDAIYADGASALAWYTLLPRRRVYGTRLGNVDAAARTFDLVEDDGSRATLTFDGFVSGTSGSGDVTERQSARTDAYARMRDAQLKESLGELDAAIELGREAQRLAIAAGESELAGWLSTLLARMLARTSRPASEVDAAIEEILSTTDGGPELCWEVAKAFSQRSEPRRAADWYTRALRLAPRDWIGHPPADYLTEAVISLVEIEEWDEALRLIDSFIGGHTQGHPEAVRVRALVYWRSGSSKREDITRTPGIHWLHNYWAFEHMWVLERPDPEAFLARLRGELHGTEHAPWIRSLEAEVLFRLGRTEEALPIIRQAWESVTADPTDSTTRIHREVVEKRLRAIEQRGRSF